MWPVVLYFHHVGKAAGDSYTSIDLGTFTRMVEALASELAFARWRDVLTTAGHAPEPQPSVLFSFDDGYAETAEMVLPVLSALDTDGMFFVITDEVGRKLEIPLGSETAYASWDRLREIVAVGGHIGAHGVTHTRLDTLSRRQQRVEISGSTAAIEKHVGIRPQCFAYPYGAIPEPGGHLGLPQYAFATGRTARRCWRCHPHDISRHYLSKDEPERWIGIIRRWRNEYEGSECVPKCSYPDDRPAQ